MFKALNVTYSEALLVAPRSTSDMVHHVFNDVARAWGAASGGGPPRYSGIDPRLMTLMVAAFQEDIGFAEKDRLAIPWHLFGGDQPPAVPPDE